MNSCHRFGHFAARTFWSVVVAGALLAATSGIAAATGLFDNATQADLRTAAQIQSTQPGDFRDRLIRRSGSPGALRDRVVRLNPAELARIVPSGADNAANRLDRAKNLTGAVTLDLFPGVSVTAQRTDIEAPDEGGYVWTGEQTGARHAYVTLVINDNAVTGQIQAGRRLYSIEPVSGPVHRIIEIDQDKIRDDLHIEVPPGFFEQKGEATEPAPEADPKAKTTINVMVANTTNARNECRAGTVAQKRSCMQARINLAISLANQSFKRSGVLIKYTRVGGENEINYNELAFYGGGSQLNNYLGSLCDVSNFDCTGLGVANNHTAPFSALRGKRDTVAADLVVLMRKQGAACGIAWVPDPPTGGTSSQGYSVVTSTKGGVYNCIEGHTLAHETGHNMGLQHDRRQRKLEIGSFPPGSKFNFGHVDNIGHFFTIMAYRSSCSGTCSREGFYSNPNKNEPDSGRPLGVAPGVGGASGSAFAAKTLNNTKATVAGYR